MNDITQESYYATKICYILFLGYWLLSSFEGYVNGSLGAISRYYIFALILFILITARKLQVTGSQIAIAIWAIYYVASLLWSPNPEQGMLYFNSVIAMLVLLLLIMGMHFEKRFVDWCIQMMACSSLLLGILGLLYSQPYYGWIQSRRVLTLFGVQLDPNNMVALYAYGAGLGLYYFLFEVNYKWYMRLLYGIASCINIYNILMCGSRSGIVILAVIVLILLVFQPATESKVKIFLTRVLIIVAITLLAVILISYLPPEVWMRMSGQDENLSFLDATGRTERWLEGISLWWNTNFLFGCGWGAFECHGTFFTFLVDTGLIGIVLFGGVLAKIGLDCVRNRRTQALLIMAAGIIPAMLIGAQNRRFFWNAIILPVMIINQYRIEFGESYNPVYELN